ncbi:MAG TPA: hypothetical protein VF767_05475 [Bryobacteraceae bacterium]
MRTRILAAALALTLWPLAAGVQEPPPQDDVKLPSGKSQREEILKSEHQKSLRDIVELRKLAGELQAELEENDYHVLSISALKKTEQIEKLAHKIRDRMKR